MFDNSNATFEAKGHDLNDLPREELDHVIGGVSSSAPPTIGSPPPPVIDRDPLQPDLRQPDPKRPPFTHATF